MKLSVGISVAGYVRVSCRWAAVLAISSSVVLQSFGAEPTSSETNSGEEAPVQRATAGVRSVSLKRNKSSIGSLLYVQSGSGSVGQFTTITGEATPISGGGTGELAFDRFLGPLTMKGLNAIMKGVESLHSGWPGGQRITISFSEKIAPVELEAANLPAALLIDSMIRDWDIAPSYAVIGMLQPSGNIDAVGAIAGRLDGAARGRVTRLAVPEKNQTEVSDYLLSAGIMSFVGTQVFTVKHYNDAGKLAFTKLAPDTAEAFQLFGTVQRTLSALGPVRAVELLRDPRVQGTLQKVLAVAPNHLSARVLLDWGTGQHTQISLGGSMDAIDRYGTTLLRGFRAKNSEAIALPKDRITSEIAQLRVLRDRIDTQVRPYLDALLKFGEALQKAQTSGGSSRPAQSAIDTAREQTKQEWVNVVRLRQTAREKE